MGQEIELALKRSIKECFAPGKIQEAAHYALFPGGKRLRPRLALFFAQAFGAPRAHALSFACAIEFIHNYTLIHDDLPAMDNADLRRGKPSCHKAYNEATAILAGDALQPLAFEIIAAHPSKLTAEQRLQMIQVLTHASGISGMAAGQSLDLIGVNTLNNLAEMYHLKTGMLLTACVKLGAIASKTRHPNHLLEKFAQCIGHAFQIQDDLLDIEGTVETLGKPHKLDQTNQKITYPTLIGIEQSRQQVQSLHHTALESIAFLKEQGNLIKEFTDYLLHRKN